MVQGFLPRIVTDGELSLVFLAGEYCMRCASVPGRGNSACRKSTGAWWTARSRRRRSLRRPRARSGPHPTPLYARVDGVVADATLVVTELELLEPKLYFRWDDGAAETMAGEIEKKIGARG